MTGNDYLIVSGLITALIALTKAIETLVARVASKKNGNGNGNGHGKGCLTAEEHVLMRNTHGMLRDMHDVIEKTDQDGLPMCYMPRSFARSQEKILEMLQEILQRSMSLQERQGAVLERIECLLQRQDNKTGN